MEFRILGPLEVADDSGQISIPGGRQRQLLAVLLLRRNEVTATDQLLEKLWGEHASPSSQNALQAVVSRLRRALPGERLLTRPPGYLLRLAPNELDAERFERLLEQGRTALAEQEVERAAGLLREALTLWRGPALADFLYEPFAQAEIARLEELRLDALEERIDADLALGRHAELVPELEALVAEYPLRERPRGQLMLALYRSGRQADALDVYRATRTTLLDELGLEPGPELRALERRILAQEATLEHRAPARPRPTPMTPPETRKTVTVLFCDLADSTELTERLDPEVLRDVLGRYASAASEAVTAHGGTMEKFIGDAVVAVFGIPALHEDDALRAIRAAVELRERLGELARRLGLALRPRIGIETGEVVTADAQSGGAVATGAAVTTAARLEQRASPGEILLGEATRRLVAGAVRLEPRGELALKGKRVEVTVWNLVELLPEAPPFVRRLETPLVGREVELGQLCQSFARAVRERSPHLFTVFGPAGIGKTRLARELAATVADDATVLVGRCLSYGEGITFWPLREILLQTPEGELRTRVSALLGGHDGDVVADGAPASTEEIFVAARRLVEALARERPLVVVLEDLHWADPTFLDFVEYLAGRASEAPMLLLCLARGELLELRETWGGGMENASALRLEPLAADETEALLDALEASSAARARVKDVAEGNPLFVEQMLAWLEEVGGAEHERGLPPTIQALLAARLDRLGPGEAAVVHRAAVIGRDFDSVAVLELLPTEAKPSAPRHLDVLVRKGLVKSLGSEPDGGGRFRFAHALVQDAAYRMVPKRLRAVLHERFADWLERAAGERAAEDDEIIGYHFEQAHRWLAELGLSTERGRELAEKGAERLAASGLRAFARGDMPAAANLLERAAALLPADDRRRLNLLPSLGRALTDAGQLERADSVLSEAVESGRATGERGVAADAAVALSFVRLHTDPQSTHSKARLELENAIRVFEELHDEGGLARALGLAGVLRLWDGQAATAVEELERAAGHAHAAADRAQEVESLRYLLSALRVGRTPVASALERVEDVGRRARGHRRLAVAILQQRAHLEAMRGHFDAARELIAEAQSSANELGLEMELAARVLRSAGEIELLAGNPPAAERALRRAYEALQRMGVWTELGGVVPAFAEALYAQGRAAEAISLIDLAARWSVSEDVEAQIGLRRVRAKLLAQQGDLKAAERLAREATELAARTDNLDQHATALADLAEVLRLADRPKEATEALEEATRLYEQKGNVVAARTLRALRAEPAMHA